jgi:hypothetical protein
VSVSAQLAIAIGFYLAPAMVKDGDGVPFFLLVEAIFCTSVFGVVSVLFKSDPALAKEYISIESQTTVTHGHWQEEEKDKEGVFQGMYRIMHDKAFLALTLGFGSILGMVSVTWTVQIVAPFFDKPW